MTSRANRVTEQVEAHVTPCDARSMESRHDKPTHNGEPMKISSILCRIGLLLVLGASNTAVADTTIYLVRHAEKARTGKEHGNPELTTAGKHRAADLARVLRSVNLSAIYTTDYKRARSTAAPVSELKNTPVIVYDNLDGLARKLLEKYPNQKVLVVGHSNTIPDLIQRLGVKGKLSIEPYDYDDLFVALIKPDGNAQLEHLHYGNANPKNKATREDH